MTLAAADDRNALEIAYWNGPGGQRWLNRQQVQDALLAPVAEVLFDRAAARVGEIVLDIGCGCGTTSIALARRAARGAGRPCARHRRVLADAGASAPACAERVAGRLRPRRRYSLSIRAWPRRSALLAFRRDVLR